MNNRYLRLLLALVLPLLLALACRRDKPIDPPPTPVESGFPDNVNAIITRSCAFSGCHGNGSKSGGLDLSSWTAMFHGSSNGSVVIPYTADFSPLFSHANRFTDLGPVGSDPMPPDTNNKLSRADITTLKNWINAGAPNKSGTVKWTDKQFTPNLKGFMLNSASDLMTVVDLNTSLVMRHIQVGQYGSVVESPHYLTISPDRKYVYMTLILGGTVEKYRTTDYGYEGRVTVGNSPAHIAISPDGRWLIVSHWNDSPGDPKLTLVNTTTMVIQHQLTGDGDLLSKPHGLVLSSNMRYCYVVANNGDYYARVEFDTTAGFVNIDKYGIDPSVVAPGPSTLYQPYHIIFNQDSSRLIISCEKKDDVRVFNTATGAYIGKIDLVTGSWPRMLKLDPVTGYVLVTNRDRTNFAQQGAMKGSLSIVDPVSLTNVNEIFRVGHMPYGVDIDLIARKAYLVIENDGSIDPPHHPVPGSPYPPGKFYMIDLNSGSVVSGISPDIAAKPNLVRVIHY